MTTTNKGLEQPANNSYVDIWDGPLNTNFGVIDIALGGNQLLNVTGVTSTTLTESQYRNLILTITGSVTGTPVYRIPSGKGGQWTVRNNTSSTAGTVTIAGPSPDAGIAIPAGSVAIVYSDGTNVRTTTPVAGSNNQIIFNSGNILTGSANFTWNGTTFAVTGATTISEGANIGSGIFVVDKTNNRIGVNNATPGVALDVTGAVRSSSTVADSIGNVRTVVTDSKVASYTLVSTDAGKLISITTGGIVVPSGVFSPGQTISIYNDSATSQVIVQGGGTILRLAGFVSSGNKTIAGYGLGTIVCVASNVFVVGGGGVS
jgi:hypothetical protein